MSRAEVSANRVYFFSGHFCVFGRVSRGRPGGYPGGHPGPKTFTQSLGAQENKVLCADVLDPKARTSIRGSQKNVLQGVSGLVPEVYLNFISASFWGSGGLAPKPELRVEFCSEIFYGCLW